MRQGNGKPFTSLRVGSAKNLRDSLSPVCKMYRVSFSIPKMFKYKFKL